MNAKAVKYCQRALCILFCTILLVQPTVLAGAMEPPTIDWVTLELRDVNYSDVRQALERGQVDGVLYPSGMDLPTKYWDIYMFATTTGMTMPVPRQVATMLELNWPVEGGKYTYAEVLSCCIYYSLYTWLYYSDFPAESGVPSVAAAYAVTQPFGIYNYSGRNLTAELGESTALLEILDRYRELLEPYIYESDNPENADLFPELMGDNDWEMPLTIGPSFDWFSNSNYEGARYMFSDDVYKRIADFLGTRKGYLNLIEAKLEAVPKNYMMDECVMAYNGVTPTMVEEGYVALPCAPLLNGDLPSGAMDLRDSDSSGASAASSSSGSSTGQGTTVSSPISGGIPYLPSGEQNLELSTLEPNEYVGAFRPNGSSGVETNGRRGVQDILTGLALVIVVVGLFGLLIIDFLRRRDDPMRKWKRRY